MFDLDEGFKVIIWRPVSSTTGQVTGQVTGQATGQVTGQVTGQITIQITGQVAEGIRRVSMVIYGEMKESADIQNALELKHRESFRDIYLIPSIEEGYLEMTIPDKPSSPYQKYRLTEKGLNLKRS